MTKINTKYWSKAARELLDTDITAAHELQKKIWKEASKKRRKTIEQKKASRVTPETMNKVETSLTTLFDEIEVLGFDMVNAGHELMTHELQKGKDALKLEYLEAESALAEARFRYSLSLARRAAGLKPHK